MKVIALQYDIAWEDQQANFEIVDELLDGSNFSAGDMIVLPEMFSTGFSMDSNKVAEPVDGPTFNFVSALAKHNGVYVIAGWPVKQDDGCHNQAVAFDCGGNEIGRYTKVHSFSLAGESENYKDGNSLCIIQAGDVKVGITVCYDLRFPELFREYLKNGVTMFVTIANWPASRTIHWQTLLQARAIENQAYVVGVNRIGNDPNVIDGYCGDSMIIDPRGRTLADAKDKQQAISAEIELGEVRRWRKKFPAIRDIKDKFVVRTKEEK